MDIVGLLRSRWGNLSLLDVLVICSYMLLCLYVGFRKSGKIKNIKDFAIGDGSISTFVLIATIYATHIGAGVTFGTIEKIGSIGILFAIATLANPLKWLIKIWIFGRNIEQFRGCVSITDIMERLYGFTGRWLTNLTCIVIAVGSVAAQASALGLLLHYYLNIPVAYGVIGGVGVLITYSAFGGVKAVALTDVLQFGIFYVIIPLLGALGFHKVGGFAGIQHAIPSTKFMVDLTSDNLLMLTGFIIYAILPQVGASFTQRFLMAQNSVQLIRSLKIVALLDAAMSMTLCLLGFIVMALLPEITDHRSALLGTINVLLPAGVIGLMICGLLAVIMSTADSFLNTAGVLFAHNIAKEIWPSMTEQSELKIARISTIILGVLSIILALTGAGILEIVWFIDNFYVPVILIPLSAGFLGLRTNQMSFICGVSIGVLSLFLGAYIQGAFDLVSLTFGLIGSTIALLAAHYFQIWSGILERRKTSRHDERSRTPLAQKVKLWFSLKYIIAKAHRSVINYPPRYYHFALLGLAYCLYPLLFLIAASNNIAALVWHIELTLRMIGVLGCVGLLFQEVWPERLRTKYLGIYWYVLLLWCLPLLGVYGVALPPYDWMWFIHGLLGVFMLIAFVEPKMCVPILVVGGTLGYAAALYHMHIGQEWLATVPNVAQKLGMDTVMLLYLPFGALVIRELLTGIKEIKTTSIIDPLTQLYNRRYLNMQLEEIVQEKLSTGIPVSVLAVDIDRFKPINDTYGHLAGDQVLKELAFRLKSGLWPIDICARLGGEEFLIVLPDTNIYNAETIADRLRKSVEQQLFTISAKPGAVQCTISIGVTTLQPGDTVEILIARADAALYRAKASGRNRVVSSATQPLANLSVH